jgi:lipoyl(octanoyl) transferase
VNDVEWRVTPGLTGYLDAVATMENRAAAIRSGEATELIWLVEHPPLYTAGTTADPAELLDARLPVFATGRGGRYTYHGPGQRVIYVLLDLDRRGRDIRRFVAALEDWIIATLARLDLAAYRIAGRVGVWTGPADDPAKIAAIGVRIRRWVTLHGAAINVDPDLGHFTGIVPCGIGDARVTSLEVVNHLKDLGIVDRALHDGLPKFLSVVTAAPPAKSLEERDYLV